jgi:hypothetical protein
MQRLAFSMPDFCRVSWTSEVARDYWQPRIERGARVWHRLELETVLLGQRPAGLIAIAETNMAAVLEKCAKHRMDLRPLYSFAPGTRYISNLTKQHSGGGIQMCIVGSPKVVAEAEVAFMGQQSTALGAIFGYPRCCTAFFAEVWDRQHFIDTSWKMAERSCALGGQLTTDDRTIVASAPPELNLLIRWLGIRPVFHLPCSFACEPSFSVAREIAAVAAKVGCTEEIESIYRMLRWPVQWSALHGIAEIETPVLRVATRTDPTALKYTVRVQGDAGSVAHASRGNRFPFVEPRSRHKGRTIRSATEPRTETEAEQWLYVENGYRSLAAMERAFAIVTTPLLARLPRSVAHLACRNGALLHFVLQRSSGLIVSGVDSDASRIARARQLLPSYAERLRIARLDDAELSTELEPADAYIVMAGRLLELPMDKAHALLLAMQRQSSGILLYAFDDWLKHSSLDDMAAKLKVGLSLDGVTTDIAAARWLA